MWPELLVRVLDNLLAGLALVDHRLLLVVGELTHLVLEVLNFAEHAVHLLVVLQLHLYCEPDCELIENSVRQGMDLLYQPVDIRVLKFKLCLCAVELIHIANHLLPEIAGPAAEATFLLLFLLLQFGKLHTIMVIPTSFLFTPQCRLHNQLAFCYQCLNLDFLVTQ